MLASFWELIHDSLCSGNACSPETDTVLSAWSFCLLGLGPELQSQGGLCREYFM